MFQSVQFLNIFILHGSVATQLMFAAISVTALLQVVHTVCL